MRKRSVISGCLIAVILSAYPLAIYAQEAKSIKLPAPRQEGGMPLMQALKQRKSGRAFSQKSVSLQVLSELLWAAYGINRPQTGGRTVPTTMDMREIDIYVIMAEGTYVFDAQAAMLQPVTAKDLRDLAGLQPYVREAPVNLMYVADLSKMGRVAKEADFYSAADTGFVSQNVYLYCASEGLATVVRGWVDREVLSKALKLRADQRIILGQTVGYPKE